MGKIYSIVFSPTGGTKPIATDSCVQCGTCAKACPAEAIPADAPNTTIV